MHPKHLDAQALVALWREGLLARAVLRGATKGYQHHPQLERFRRRADPVAAIEAYLLHVSAEAATRGYRFHDRRLRASRGAPPLRRQAVHEGQLAYEWKHLLRKLWLRDRVRWRRERWNVPTCHPSFRVVPGGVERWERPESGRRPPRLRLP